GNQPFVNHVDTASSIRDMEQLRRAMSIQKFSYIGFSYGTFMGSRYANLYPGHLRATVLDAVVDRNITDKQLLTEVNGAFELGWQKFKLWCQQTSACQLHGQNLDAVFAQQVTKARANPIPAPNNPFGNRPVNDWELTLAIQAVIAPGNVTYSWVDEILRKAQLGDASLASLIYDSATGYDPSTDSYSPDGTHRSIFCEDSTWSRSLRNAQDVQNFAAQMQALSPRFGAANVYQSPVQCFKFPIPPIETPPLPSKVGIGDGSHTLLIGATGDVITPLPSAVRISTQIVGSRLLTRVGDGHVSLGKSRCVEKAVNDTLIRLQLPNFGTFCPTDSDLYTPEPPPVLEPSSSLRNGSASSYKLPGYIGLPFR
ncbi:MAG TPA: alpha/beta fold hydrolase, partial [Candidatus Polarisedimenticolaceae bacterium]|nr:alpha/beta fold hydrolase [Candidatus Polarisedimenticolaceae bacterium]